VGAIAPNSAGPEYQEKTISINGVQNCPEFSRLGSALLADCGPFPRPFLTRSKSPSHPHRSGRDFLQNLADNHGAWIGVSTFIRWLKNHFDQQRNWSQAIAHLAQSYARS